MHRLVTFIVLLVSSSSCSDDGHPDAIDSGIDRSIQELREEVGRHHRAVFDLQDMTRVRAEMQRHDDSMLSMMDRMHDSITTTSHCSAGATDSMRQMMEDMETQMDRHASDVAEADRLEDVRAACTVHVEAMTGSLDAMHASTRSSCMSGR